MSENKKPDMVELSEKQASSRRSRNIAIGVCLAALVIIFYAATIVKMGPRAADKPMLPQNSMTNEQSN